MTEGWVIMNANMDQYRAWQDGGTVWVKDLADATFYARRVDAEAVHLDDDAAWHVVLRPLPDGGEAVHTGQLRDDQSSSPPPSGEVREASLFASPEEEARELAKGYAAQRLRDEAAHPEAKGGAEHG